MSIVFHCIECAAFILPALPDSIIVRLAILTIYFIGHYFKIQNIYLKFKKNYNYEMHARARSTNSLKYASRV